MSPWVATTRLSLVATITLQPVPQNRHGALFHFSSVAARSVTRLARERRRRHAARRGGHRGSLELEHLAPIELGFGHDGFSRAGQAASVAWKTSEAENTSGSSAMVVERRAERAGVRRLDHDDELAFRIAAVDLAAGERHDRGFHLGEPLGPRLHQHAGDLGARRRDQLVRIQQCGRRSARGDRASDCCIDMSFSSVG